jgi:hypothetical protein
MPPVNFTQIKPRSKERGAMKRTYILLMGILTIPAYGPHMTLMTTVQYIHSSASECASPNPWQWQFIPVGQDNQ